MKDLDLETEDQSLSKSAMLPSNETARVTEAANVLERFSLKREKIKELEQRFSALTINGVGDKKGYELTISALREVRQHRLSIDKDHKALKENALNFGRLCDRTKNLLHAEIAPLEDGLEADKKRIDNEIQAEKDARQAIINERVKRRMDALLAVDAGNAIHPMELPGMEEKDFRAHLEVWTAKFNERKAEEKRQADRLAELEASETERKRKEDADRIRISQEQAERQAALDAREREQREAKAAIEAERKEIEDAKRAEIDKAGRAEEMRIATEKAAEEARIKAIAEVKKAEQEKADKEEAARKESERLAAIAPEIEKLEKYLSDIRGVLSPNIRDPKLQGVLISFTNQIICFDKAIQAVR